MRKAIALVILATMLTCSGPALAAQATLSPSLYDGSVFEKFASYTEEDGVYTVRSFAADSALRLLENGSGSGACFFTLELTGVTALGIVQPTLAVYYRGNQALNVSAVVLAVDGARYVLSAASGTATLGRRRVEKITAPLTRDALPVIQSLAGAQSVQLRLCGERVFTTTIAPQSAESEDTLRPLCLTGSQAMLDVLATLPVDDYALWDLSAGWWENQSGFAPRMEAAPLDAEAADGLRYDKLGMLVRGDKTGAVKSAQSLLISQGFMAGTAAQTFSDEMRAAVLSAQRYYGLIESGCVDAQLAALLGGAQPDAAPDKPQPESVAVGAAHIGIARAWLAKGVAPTAPQESGVTPPLNSDNLLLIADGTLESAAPAELRLYRDMQASFVCGEYQFAATLVCEVDEGKAFSTDVLPLARTRVVAYAEIPEAAARLSGWRLVFSCGEESVTWELK